MARGICSGGTTANWGSTCPAWDDICYGDDLGTNGAGAQQPHFKCDLAGAFNLVTLDPESTLLMCCEVAEFVSLVWVTGNSGHVDIPYVFHSISRVLHMAARSMGPRGKLVVQGDPRRILNFESLIGWNTFLHRATVGCCFAGPQPGFLRARGSRSSQCGSGPRTPEEVAPQDCDRMTLD